MQIMKVWEDRYADVIRYDRHIAEDRLRESLRNGKVYALCRDDRVVGVLRYSLFWQSIPFVDLLYIHEGLQNRGYGRQMMARWEADMRAAGFAYAMLSTQADETAKYFYEKLGYHLAGSFLPPEQDADELIYWKAI